MKYFIHCQQDSDKNILGRHYFVLRDRHNFVGPIRTEEELKLAREKGLAAEKIEEDEVKAFAPGFPITSYDHVWMIKDLLDKVLDDAEKEKTMHDLDITIHVGRMRQEEDGSKKEP